MNRKERRAAAHLQRKSARKAGFPSPEPGPQQPPTPSAGNDSNKTEIPNPSSMNPKPPRPPTSEARFNANRANSQSSTGPVTAAGRAASSQNHTKHGLARHNGVFKLLSSEDPAGFEALQASLAEEHQPETETEVILVNEMAESNWLASRALNLQHICFDPQTGQVADCKLFSLYLRYHTTHQRAFHKALNQLIKLTSERRKEQVGFEAQNHKQAEMERKNHLAQEAKRVKAENALASNHEYKALKSQFERKFGFAIFGKENSEDFQTAAA